MHAPRLRQLFARYATYCGSSPLRAPATLMLIAHVERAGVWLVKGGMHTLARPRTDPSLSAVTRCQVAHPSGFELAHHTVFFGSDYPDEFDAIFRRRETTADPTVYVCAQDRSGAVDAGRDGPERLFALANAPARPHTPDEITAADARIADVFAHHGLATDDERGCTVTSPDDFARLFPATDGALYGRPTHGWTGSFSRPGSRSRVRGLYLAGGSVHPGAGVPMATLSGQLAADALAGDLGLERGGKIDRPHNG